MPKNYSLILTDYISNKSHLSKTITDSKLKISDPPNTDKHWYRRGTLPIKIAREEGPKSSSKRKVEVINIVERWAGLFRVNGRKIGTVATYLRSLLAYITVLTDYHTVV